MSFDLYFCWLKKERLDFEAVATWAVGIENFSRKGSQLWYENPTTGVYFSFDFDPQGSETLENSPVPNEYFDSGLSFGLNFNRPSFFGYEAMPFVERLAKRFGLCIVDPQVDADEPVLMTEIGSKSLKAFQWPDPPVQVISSESTEKVGRILQPIDSMLARSEFEVIGADAFIDIELPENE